MWQVMNALVASTMLTFVVPLLSAQAVHINLKHSSSAEQQTKTQLEGLLAQYNLAPWLFTREVVIDQDAIPHSHPVLTLHTRHLHQDDELLSTFIHEELHWYLVDHQNQTDAAMKDLRKLYPKVPVGYPEGARDEGSTYLHLIDCYFEQQVDLKVLGAERTASVMRFWSHDHYRWVYKTVLADGDKIAKIIAGRIDMPSLNDHLERF